MRGSGSCWCAVRTEAQTGTSDGSLFSQEQQLHYTGKANGSGSALEACSQRPEMSAFNSGQANLVQEERLEVSALYD